MGCPAAHNLCDKELKCDNCVDNPCDKRIRQKSRAYRTTMNRICFRCKYARAVALGVECGIKGGKQ